MVIWSGEKVGWQTWCRIRSPRAALVEGRAFCVLFTVAHRSSSFIMILAIVREIKCRQNESALQAINRIGKFLMSVGGKKDPKPFKIRGVNYRSRSYPQWHYTLVKDSQAGSKVVAIETMGPNFQSGATYGRLLFEESFTALSVFYFEGDSYELPHFSIRVSRGSFYPKDCAAFVEIKCKCETAKKPRRCLDMLSLLMDGMGLSFRGVRHRKSPQYARKYEGFHRKTLYLRISLNRAWISWYVN